MARSQALPIGEGAMCSVLVNKLSTSRIVAEALPNAAVNQRVEDLVATRHTIIIRSGRTHDRIYFMSPSHLGVEISAARRYVIIMVPGHADAIWTLLVAPAVRAPIVPNLPPIIAATQTIGNEIFFVQNRAKDIARVDVPPVVDGGLFEGKSWGWDGIDVVR